MAQTIILDTRYLNRQALHELLIQGFPGNFEVKVS
jgi:hypothetical protein